MALAPGGLGIEINVDGDVQISRELLRFADRLVDAKPAFREIADDLREIEKEQFESEGARGSGGWKQLADSTIAAKQAAGLDNGILKETEALFKSLTQKGGDHIEEITKDSLRFGSSDWKLPIHQHGSSDGAHPPQRRPIELTRMDRQSIVKKLQRHMVEGRTSL